MRVKLPPQKFINEQQTNRGKNLMDVLSSDIHSRRMSKQIGFKFIIDSKRLRLNKNGNLGAVSCNKLLISQMFRLNDN